MDNTNFLIEVDNSTNRSLKLLLKKAEEYSKEGRNRLEQFYRAGMAQDINPVQALIGMAMKHVTSIADMAKTPTLFSLKKWDEKVTDLRNYTYLLDALLRDMEIK